MKVLVACEFSGVVREAFRALGHDAWSCDLLTSANTEHHYQGDVMDIIDAGWDLMIAHPPCTYLTCAQNKWFLPQYAHRFPNRRQDQDKGIEFFLRFATTGIPLVCIENPIGVMSTHYRKPDQIIQPYQFGHDARKSTCLWLTGLPKLQHTNVVPVTLHKTKGGNTMSMWHMQCGSATNQPERARLRSITFQGIANAMAHQWGAL
jgi:hypothetical protein